MAQDKDQSSFMRWLGRQVGFVRSALSEDLSERQVYRREDVQEAKMPGESRLILRRTTIDEVVVRDKE